MTMTDEPELEDEPKGKGLARLNARDRMVRAAKLRNQGMTYQEIADELGYSSPQSAHRAAKSIRDQYEFETAEDYRTIQVQRLENMLAMLAPKVEKGDVRAIETSMRLLEKLDDHMGVQKRRVEKVEHHHILSIEATEDEYVQRLRALSPELEMRGSLGAGEEMNPFVADVVDAELVEGE